MLKKEIIKKISALSKKLTLIQRDDRRTEAKSFSHKLIKIQKEYDRRISEGEVVEPLVEIRDLEDLVGSDAYETALHSDQPVKAYKTNLRGKEVNFYTPNLRSLWQSAGQEYIEPELLNFIDAIPYDGVFFDVGASTGVFAIYAAMLGRKTVCFEPEVANFNILNMNAFINNNNLDDNFHAYNVALSDENSINKMYIKKFGAGAHEKILGNSKTRDGSEIFSAEYTQSIITLTMDQFCVMSKFTPTDIKIDVDGAELRLISGMKKTLSNPNLKRIFIEVSEAEKSSKEALKIILDYGFKMYKKNRVQNYFTEFNYTLHRAE